MGNSGVTSFDYDLEAFAQFAKSRLGRQSWEDLEPLLAASWIDLDRPNPMPWAEAGPMIRSRVMPVLTPKLDMDD
jgi:hypothetical protein